MHLSFLLFIVAFVVALYLSLKILGKLKEIISATQSKENSLIEEIGCDVEYFHCMMVALMADYVQRQPFDVGSFQFIYNYIKNAVPEKMQEGCIVSFVNSTCVFENNRPRSIIDINKTIKKNQLVFVDKDLVLLSAADVSSDLYADDETFIRTAQSFGKKFSETGRKYMAYLLCKSVCAA